jgi:alkanesulfonate monooxygenase SsuD/methylene tetrahydromethanopterin reductase-like flavin-dependent oxidoreductase (luciferase family)
VRAGVQGPGKVALMLHTFLGSDRDQVKALVRPPMLSYLHESADLAIRASHRAAWDAADASLKAQTMEVAFDRYFDTASLMGTPATCRPIVERAARLGVTEICCLIDFGLPADVVLEGLALLTELKASIQAR